MCSCSAAWTGDFCELDRDGCEDDPCFPGITCVDAIAPLEGNQCGPCPTGLVGDGFKCYGECLVAKMETVRHRSVTQTLIQSSLLRLSR